MSAQPQDAATLAARVAEALKLPPRGVAATLQLLGEGNTVPFVARYRKEATGGLDEVQIRDIEARHEALVELESRRAAILKSIEEQGKLTPELAAKIAAAGSKTALEDLYLPYKKKRKTRASVARERGLEPLALRILAQPKDGDPLRDAAAFVDPGKEVPDAEAALAGARDIVAEVVSEDAAVRADARRILFAQGELTVKATKKGKEGPTPFDDYHQYVEPLRRVAPHRFQAIRRGEAEGMLKAKLEVPAQAVLPDVERRVGVDRRSRYARPLTEAIADAWERLLLPSLENELRGALGERADGAAVEVFKKNLEAILMAAPLGPAPVLAIDPGLRTGSKCVALSATGGLLEHQVLYLAKGDKAQAEALGILLRMVKTHRPRAVAVGNGTGGRETEAFVKKVLAEAGHKDVVVVSVNEAGASVYSASDVARAELGEVDLTVRGAVSIGRRLQDPLSELVKIDPKAMGVGQYQHDVPQGMLTKKLDEVVESCVNRVGVELNTASPALLTHVAGIGPKLAARIVERREAEGAFSARGELMKVSGLGKKAFEQAAGFLRIRGADNPLDGSAVHPERYPVVAKMAKDLGVPVAQLVGNAALVARIDPARYANDEVGLPTLQDILRELEKPGRDPRDRFEPPKFRDDVNTMADLKPGMILEGVVTNVVAFGAFVDIGVHQDGLVHVSELADRFVEDPTQVVRSGDKLTVKVLAVDLPRKRISLSAKQAKPGRA
jgi:uncharacterized protein